MIVDGLTLPAGCRLSSDVCVVGAGPAGLSLASELAGQALRICVLEAGPARYDPLQSGVAELEPGDDELTPRSNSRWGGLGGTANLWNTFLHGEPGARYLRLDEIDFEHRQWLPFSGWPFAGSTLRPYYRRAERVCMPDQAPSADKDAFGARSVFPVDPNVLTTTVERFERAAVFTKMMPAALGRRPEVTVVCNATVCRIDFAESHAAVAGLEVCGHPGQRFYVTAKLYVLAAGGIENPRLLLESVAPYGKGPVNPTETIGRFFMDHHRLNGGSLVPFHASTFSHAAAYDLRDVGGVPVQAKLTMARDVLRNERILNNSTVIWPYPSRSDDAAVDAVKTLLGSIKRKPTLPQLLQNLRRVLVGREYLLGVGVPLALFQRTLAPTIDRGGWSRIPRAALHFRRFNLIHQFEQAPDPENRVTLSDRRDRFGRRLARVQVQLTDLDRHSFGRAKYLVAHQLRERHIGRITDAGDTSQVNLHQTGGLHHHLGATRMHISPRLGVVDANMRVHGLSNLFVAGSSVFPTGGYANPTLTVVALAVRLADHIKAIFAGSTA